MNDIIDFMMSPWLKSDATFNIIEIITVINISVFLVWLFKIILNKGLTARQVYIRSFIPSVISSSFLVLYLRWYVAILFYTILGLLMFKAHAKWIVQIEEDKSVGVNSPYLIQQFKQKQSWDKLDEKSKGKYREKHLDEENERLNPKKAIFMFLIAAIIQILIVLFFSYLV